MEAVKVIENNGDNVSATAKQVGLPMQPLANWQGKANQGMNRPEIVRDSTF